MRLLNHLRVSGALLNSYGNSVQCCLAIARLSVRSSHAGIVPKSLHHSIILVFGELTFIWIFGQNHPKQELQSMVGYEKVPLSFKL